MKLVLEEGVPQCLLHLPFPRVGGLPPVETHRSDDLVDVIDDPSHHDRRLSVPGLVKEFGQRRLAAVNVLLDRCLPLHLDDVSREIEKLLQELDAEQQALLVTLLEIFEALRQGLVLRVARHVSGVSLSA